MLLAQNDPGEIAALRNTVFPPPYGRTYSNFNGGDVGSESTPVEQKQAIAAIKSLYCDAHTDV